MKVKNEKDKQKISLFELEFKQIFVFHIQNNISFTFCHSVNGIIFIFFNYFSKQLPILTVIS